MLGAVSVCQWFRRYAIASAPWVHARGPGRFLFLTRAGFASILFLSAHFSGQLVDDEGGATWPEPRDTCRENGHGLFRAWTVKTLSTLPHGVKRLQIPPGEWSLRSMTDPTNQRRLDLKSPNALIGLSIMFSVIAAALSAVIWNDVSLIAKIGLFAFGFGSGVTAGRWLAERSAH